MKKTLSIHLGRQLFVIEEDAFDRLQQYLQRLENSLQGENGTAEIIEDIEMRFAELLMSYLGETRKVVTITDVEKGIASLGEPEVISEDTTVRDEPHSRTSSQQTSGQRRFFRDPEGGILGGVCSGLAAYLNIDPVLVRIIFILLAFAGFMVPLYIILWVIVPGASTPSERLQMQGKPVTVDALKDEIGKAAERIKDDTLRARDRFRTNNEHILKRGNTLAGILVKIIGIALIGITSLGLILFTLTVTGVIDFIPMTGDEEYASVHDFLQLVAPGKSTFDLMWAGILLTGFAGHLLVIAFGTRLLMNKGARFLKISFIVLPAIIAAGIICGAISGMKTGRDFAVYAEVEQQHLTSNAETLAVSELPHYSGNHRIVTTGGVDFINIENRMITEQGVIITYRPSKDSLFHIYQIVSAHGVDRAGALRRSGHIRHEIQLLDGKLIVDPYYSYPVQDGFRSQEVEVIIEVPERKRLSVNELTITDPDREYSGKFYSDEPFEAWD